MITHLSVRNYQSLHVVDLDLAPFTVIVGPSSSGKSALTRALRTLATNTRGSAFVSTWAKRAVIAVDLADTADSESARGTLTLTRGAKTEDNVYEITPPPGLHEDAPSARFTKLNAEVPTEVTEFLGIAPEDSGIVFASQFDKPYLLADSPAEVARAFAALTNVSTVFAAAREANRTRLNTAGLLRTRKADHEATLARREEFVALAAQRRAQNTAEERLSVATRIEATMTEVRSLLGALGEAEKRILATAPTPPLPSLDKAERLAAAVAEVRRQTANLAQAAGAVERTSLVLDIALPDIGAVEAAGHAVSAYRATLALVKRTTLAAKAAHVAVAAASEAHASLEKKLSTTLIEAGHCPTCGQSTAALAEHETEHTA